jgi:hypothetical protein
MGTRALDRCGCLELVDTAQRRGATEHFYKAAPRSFVGAREWRSVPRSVRGGVSAASLQTFVDKAVAALEARTTHQRLLAAERRSARRLARQAAGERISAVVALANFEAAGSKGA